MKREHFIGLDTHGTTCDMAVVTGKGNVVSRDRCDTTIEALRKLIDPVPGRQKKAADCFAAVAHGSQTVL